MFAWLKKWITPTSQDLYSPGERQIFKYFDGQKIVAADPIVLYKRLMDKSTEIDIDRKVAASPSKDALKAHDSLTTHVRGVFSVKSLAEGGLTDGETVELLDHFLTYLESQKKSSLTSTISSPNSAASAPSLAGDQPTPNSSACGSTANGVSTAKPTPSPLASPLPMAASTPVGATGRPSPTASPRPS